ncbi:MAG TPA: 3-hydroxyacyl-CoA dehydrogenase NAD-binding domain-containing protein, partial [Vicinamibacterales bacterium]|nr:3-hydroxyacyl-CoA dehydrogenase NAD-binding domain-containing protein [Vicinamibacterales bacterium]
MIKRVGVVGAGTMGNGIAQVFAQSGFEVRLCDAVPAAIDRARGSIEKSLGKFVEKGKLAAGDRDAALGRLSTGSDLDALADVDYVVEAIAEVLDAKLDIFRRLDTITRPGVILSSNTSSISITVLGAATKR